MRVVFMGTPDFSVPCLKKLHDLNHRIVSVFTQPDRPKGRGLKLAPPPVKVWAENHGLTVYQPEKLKDPEVAEYLRGLRPDVVIIIAYRILPAKLISIPIHGCINLHASLLPAYRGAAPIQHALFNGETETGVTVIKITPRVDAGDMLMQEKIPIGPDEDAGSVHDRLSELSAELLGKTLEQLENNSITLLRQDTSKVTKAPKITREDMYIQWDKPAEWLHNRIRGLSPRPGALAQFNGRNVKIYKSRPSSYTVPLGPGEIGGISRDDGLLVGTATTPIFLDIVQPENKKRMTGTDFARGYKADPGMFFSDGK